MKQSKITKNNKNRKRLKGWNGIAPLKPRSNIKPIEQLPIDNRPVHEGVHTLAKQMKTDPSAQRLVTEVVKGVTGQKR